VSGTPNRFEVGGTEYVVSRRKVKDSLRGLKLISKVLLPAFAAGASAPSGSLGDAAARLVEGLDCLPELLDLFAPVTQFVGPTGKPVALQAFVEDQFGGRVDLLVEFLTRCVQFEYGAFLAESGGSGFIAQMAARARAAMAARSSSPTG
jgi:hypothetical protein